VVCPGCKKPFEIKMPTAVVTSVQEVDEKKANKERMDTEPDERTLAKVHPVAFRDRPVATLIVRLVFLIAVVAIVMSVANTLSEKQRRALAAYYANLLYHYSDQ